MASKLTLLWLQLGKNDDSVLADDFRFEFPVIKMDKKVSQRFKGVLHVFCKLRLHWFWQASADCQGISKAQFSRLMQRYLNAIRTFDFKQGLPNYSQNAYDWRVDEYEPQRWVCCALCASAYHCHLIFFHNIHACTGGSSEECLTSNSASLTYEQIH